jgi:hypothetical protein
MRGIDKRTVQGVFVKLLHHKQTDRGMTLLPFETRCVRQGEVHELVTTDQKGAGPGDRIDRVGFLGFIEVLCAGVVQKGDEAWVDGRHVGDVLGFDDCHFPNHLNVLIAVDERVSAQDIGLRVEQTIELRPAAAGALREAV